MISEKRYVLALDAGTTSCRALLIDHDGLAAGAAQEEFSQYYPQPGWVEHDATEIWDVQRRVMLAAAAQAEGGAAAIAAVGITNQRETTVVWERSTGRPVGPAIVWQCRRSTEICERLRAAGAEPMIRAKTGLLLDAYFSGTKLTWLFENDTDLRRRAEAGELCFGTIDSWLLWNLSGGRVHATDVTNASRTLLFDIHRREWDEELLALMGVPRAVLPDVYPSSGVICETGVLRGSTSIPVSGVAGDQHAALFGQTCFAPGMAKNTYGTGCFLMMNTGETPSSSDNGLLTTIAWEVDGVVEYALEGSVFIAGAAVQWLRDGVGLIATAAETEALARSVPDTGGVSFVPAFTGLGAPYWKPDARGIICGLTRGTTRAHIVRAALESIALQTVDVCSALNAAAGRPLTNLKVDGGASSNDFLMQFQADLLGIPVERPAVAETTALGAAFLAGLAVGFWKSRSELTTLWRADRTFTPSMSTGTRAAHLLQWHRAVAFQA